MPNTLPPKQTAFVNAYVANNFNATQAYTDVGYSPNGARAHSSRLVAKGSIQLAISKRIEAKASAAELSLDWILGKFRAIATDPAGTRTERTAALRELGKLLGFYVERTVTVSAFVRPELEGKTVAELDAVEALLFPGPREMRALAAPEGAARVREGGEADAS